MTVTDALKILIRRKLLFLVTFFGVLLAVVLFAVFAVRPGNEAAADIALAELPLVSATSIEGRAGGVERVDWSLLDGFDEADAVRLFEHTRAAQQGLFVANPYVQDQSVMSTADMYRYLISDSFERSLYTESGLPEAVSVEFVKLADKLTIRLAARPGTDLETALDTVLNAIPSYLEQKARERVEKIGLYAREAAQSARDNVEACVPLIERQVTAAAGKPLSLSDYEVCRTLVEDYAASAARESLYDLVAKESGSLLASAALRPEMVVLAQDVSEHAALKALAAYGLIGGMAGFAAALILTLATDYAGRLRASLKQAS